MPTQTKKERNAVNAVRDFVDATACLRSYLEENDKTPLWDGTIFVYEGEPDKNENLVGTLKTQIKGTEVEAFQDKEHYRISFDELNLYMREGGLFFFVVELLKDDYTKRRIFYRALTPHTIQALVKQAKQNNRGKASKSMELTLQPLPTNCRIVEDEMVNFIRDSRKQTSFADKPGLSLAEALKGNYPLKMETSFRFQKDTPIELQMIGHPFVIYQETPYASIPVSDVEVTARATAHIEAPVKVSDVTYFSGYTRRYEQKYDVINIGDCFFIAGPRKGYENSIQPQIEIKYPRTGNIKEALHKMDFLMALMNSQTLTLGETEEAMDLGEDKQRLSDEVAYTYSIYRDIDALWQAMQIPGIFNFDDFDEQGFQQYLNVVQHVYRKEPGVPKDPIAGAKSYHSLLAVGKLHLLILFTHLHDQYYASKDAFAIPGIVNEGKHYPLLSLVLTKEPHILPDNIHYAEQIEVYKKYLRQDQRFKTVIEHDLTELKKRIPYVENKEKLERVEAFVKDLNLLVI